MLTDRLTDTQTDRHRKDKNYIPSLHTSYALAFSIARTTKGNNSKGPGPMALIFFPTIQLVILVMCTKFQVCRLSSP